MTKHSSIYTRLVKIINKGSYNKDIVLLDISDYLKLRVISQFEHDVLIDLLEKQSTENTKITTIEVDKEDDSTSKNIYILAKKVIEKKYYKQLVVTKIISDFRLCEKISRNEFVELINMIKDTYSDL